MEIETPSSDEAGSGSLSTGGSDTRGKHRILAELKRVEQESRFLEKELEDVEKVDKLQTVCEELLREIEAKPDPLLPLTNGPVQVYWDRWFQGPKDAQGCIIL